VNDVAALAATAVGTKIFPTLSLIGCHKGADFHGYFEAQGGWFR